MKPLAANTLLQNRYLIVHLIGKGGMGDVYLAIDQRLGSAVALKRTFFSGDEVFAAAFEREARTLARLRHNVLPKVSDHFIEEDTQYLIMEHIAGDDLAKRLEISRKPFPVDWVLFWADQLLDALSYLHSQEPPVIHRDIKPQNLKLTDDNSVVLLDFGLSKNTIGETRTATSTSSVVGYTPHFAPMEQIRGMGTNPRSDIYSLSATLYQLLTNLVPPETLVRAEALLGGNPDPLTPVIEINPEVSQAVSDVILKGMAVSQEKRFSDAREMQKALREVHAQIQSIDAKQINAFTTRANDGNSADSQSNLHTNISFTPSIANQPPNSSAPENFVRTENLPAPTAERKINTLFLTVIGLSIPLILATAGIGWFLTRGAAVAPEKISTPTPEIAIVAPSPEPTIEPPVDAVENANSLNENNVMTDTNTQSYNQNVAVKNQNLSEKPSRSNTTTVAKPSTRQTSRRTRTTTKATPRPTPSSKATPLPKILP